MLSDHNWKLQYTPDEGDLVKLFYVPALEDAVRYNRLTGYFNAGALALAARGLEGLVRNNGVMRMVVGCTLEQDEIEAIAEGERLRDAVHQRLASAPLAPDSKGKDALELLAWMVANEHLKVKVAVPCDAKRNPVADEAIFHEKTGVIEDRTGRRIAWTGSLNETAAGWTRNWERIHVFTSWRDPERVANTKNEFDKLWDDRASSVIVLGLPEAARRQLLEFLPEDNRMPARLQAWENSGTTVREKPARDYPTGKPDKPDPPGKPAASAEDILRDRVWSFIERAPSMAGGGKHVGDATSAVEPWPHQLRAFDRMYDHWPPRLLIADEVGLGKTIQAGMLLRQAWLSKRAKRILVLAPKAVLRQWQIELHEKFNLNWPVYDKGQLTWHPSPAWRGGNVCRVDRDRWHREPAVIASSHLMRRQDRRQALLEDAAPWDLVVLDEAHHARRRGVGSASGGHPNALLRLMQGLKERTQGLVLLTATPLQVHPGELWDLLDLLGLPEEWTPTAFMEYFENASRADPTPDAFERMAQLFRATERRYGRASEAEVAQALPEFSRLRARRLARDVRGRAKTPRRRMDGATRQAALKLMRVGTPVRRLVSRHTRELLREYYRRGLLSTRIADRDVNDRFVEMTSGERALYEAVEDYIATTYNQASEKERRAVGFVMTIYRRRLASSFRALRNTLQGRVDASAASDTGSTLAEDLSDDEVADEPVRDEDDVAAALRESLQAEEADDVRRLLEQIGQLPPDSKLAELIDALSELREAGHRQVMVFTQYTDTMDFLREELSAPAPAPALTLMCYSGRGGEVPGADGWRAVDRDTVKRRFRDGDADILLCTEAAAEGLNFQFCGALINYDMPWNPMRVEQRIGRIDRVGQRHRTIRIVNLHYEDTVETDIYRVLRERIGLFTKMVGRLQPILSRLSGTIAEAVLSGKGADAVSRRKMVQAVEAQAQEADAGSGFDIDAALDDVLDTAARTTPTLSLDDLDRVIGWPELLPPDTKVQLLGNREYGLTLPDSTDPVRVTTDPDHYREHPDSVELWSPGNRLFRAPKRAGRLAATRADRPQPEWPSGTTLKDILDDPV